MSLVYIIQENTKVLAESTTVTVNGTTEMPTTLVLFPTTSPLGTAIDLESSAATATSDAASISYFVTESISLATLTSYYVVTESPST